MLNGIKNSTIIAAIANHIEWPLVRKLVRAAKLLAIVLAYSYFVHLIYNNYTADVNYEKANAYIAIGELPKALDAANKAIDLNPLEPNYYRIRARVLINYLPKQPEDVTKQLKDSIIDDLETALALNPKNLVTIRNLVPLYYFIAADNILVGATAENVDYEYLPYAQNFYALHKHYSPNDVGVYALIAKYEKRLNLMKEYGDSVKKVAELRPDLLEWYESFK